VKIRIAHASTLKVLSHKKAQKEQKWIFVFVPFVPFCGKRKAREGGDNAVARFTGFIQFVF
jgi:hypothetical protein